MKILKNILLAICLLFSLLAISMPSAYADPVCTDNSPSCGGPSGNTGSGSGATTQQLSASLKTNPIVKNILNPIVNFLSVGVGIVVIGSIIVGGIQYAMAGESPDKVSKAKQRVINALLALAAYLLLFGFLQWIIPGGVFNS